MNHVESIWDKDTKSYTSEFVKQWKLALRNSSIEDLVSAVPQSSIHRHDLMIWGKREKE